MYICTHEIVITIKITSIVITPICYSFLKQSLCFRAVQVHSKIWQKVASSHTLPTSPHHNLPHYQYIPCQSGACEPTLTLHFHPKSIVTSYEFSQMYSDMCPALSYHAKQLHCPKDSVFRLFIPPSSQPLTTTDLFTVSQFCHFQSVIQFESYNMQPFQVVFFHLVMCT